MPFTKYDAEKLLLNSGNFSPEKKPFLLKITPGYKRQEALTELRDTVRELIKEAWAKLDLVVSPTIWSGLSELQKKSILEIKPLFRSQGSVVYKTLNMPAHAPPQEIDIDDGMYLPMNLVENNPVLMHTTMFKIIDEVLKYIALSQENWRTAKKDTCGRLITDKGIHIDVNAYAIPLEKVARFDNLVEAQKSLTALNYRASPDDIMKTLEIDEVNLAHRQKGWILSDPQTLKDWVKEAKEDYGNNFIHLSRLLKAWRDFCWIKGGPSSIALMVATYNVFCQEKVSERLDEALLQVARKLPGILVNTIYHPVLEEIKISSPSNEESSEWLREANKLAGALEQALCFATTRQDCVDKLISSFGNRVPNDADSVKSSTFEQRKKAFDAKPIAVANPAIKMRDNTMAG